MGLPFISLPIRALLPLVFLAWSANAGHAQDVSVPDYAYDMLTEIGLATTAGQKCDGLKVRDKELRASMTEMVIQMVGDGLDPNAVIQVMSSKAGLAQVALREQVFRRKHGVDATGDAALCVAIRAELTQNRGLAGMLSGK